MFTSTISLGELNFGVQSCTDPTERAMRAAYLRQVESRPAIGVTKHTAAAFGVLAAAVKQAGRSPRPRYNDLWIAAQAIEGKHVILLCEGGYKRTQPADIERAIERWNEWQRRSKK